MNMVLQDYKIDGDYITISKNELEEMAEHYWERVMHHFNDADGDHGLGEYYAGKETLVRDILKMFETLEG